MSTQTRYALLAWLLSNTATYVVVESWAMSGQLHHSLRDWYWPMRIVPQVLFLVAWWTLLPRLSRPLERLLVAALVPYALSVLTYAVLGTIFYSHRMAQLTTDPAALIWMFIAPWNAIHAIAGFAYGASLEFARRGDRPRTER